MDKKQKKEAKTIALNLLIIFVVGIVLGYVMVNYGDIVYIFGIPLAIQNVIVWGLLFLLTYFLLKRNRGG